ncbi:hypothetical protein GBA52_022787 [Prunus armeniaca]|nr:hypothetical protein GBA52_022787 [Prunus armeniaca]
MGFPYDYYVDPVGLLEEMWPSIVVTHLPTIGSNHCPILVKIEVVSFPYKKPLKFEAFWAADPKCKEVVDQS